MKQEEKLYYQLAELKKDIETEREALNKQIKRLEDQVSRYIAHIGLTKDHIDNIPEQMEASGEKMIEKITEVSKDIGQNLSDSINKQVYDNCINALKDLNAEANNVQIQVKRYNKQNRVRNIYIGLAFFVGVILTVAAIEYFIPRSQYTVYSVDGEILKVKKANS